MQIVRPGGREVIMGVIMMEWDTFNLMLPHLFLAIYKYNNLYVEVHKTFKMKVPQKGEHNPFMIYLH